MESGINKEATYYLRTPDGSVYGPVDVITLCLWATDARVIPGCQLSETRETWFPVEAIPELRLNWSVRFSDGSTYGPMNLLAVRVLAAEKSIPSDATLMERGSARVVSLDESIMPLLVDEFHRMLAGCSSMMSSSLERLRSAHQAALGEAEQRGMAVADLRAKLDRTEADLAAAVVSAADYGAKFIEAERVLRMEQDRSGRELAEVAQLKMEQESLCKGAEQALVMTRATVTELESKYEAVERALALEQVRNGKVLGEVAQMTAEVEGLSLRLAEANLAIQGREEVIRKLETAGDEGRRQAGQQLDHMRVKVERLDKALQVANQHADALACELAKTKETSRKLQAEGDLALNSLKERLEKDLGVSLQQNMALRETIDSLNGQLEKVLRESGRQQAESAEKFKRIEKEIKDSTELVARTMREMEQRERQLRDLQDNAVASSHGSRRKNAVVDAHVIHAEVIDAETLGPEDSPRSMHAAARPGMRERPVGRPGPKGKKSGMLDSVEAQLQMELRKWEALKREQKKPSPKWF